MKKAVKNYEKRLNHCKSTLSEKIFCKESPLNSGDVTYLDLVGDETIPIQHRPEEVPILNLD